MKRAALLLAFLPSLVFAQTVVIDIHKGRLVWEWTQGQPPNNGVPTEFRVRCTVNGVEVPVVVVGPTVREVPVKDVDGIGSYVCTVAAANELGESPASNAVPFPGNALPGAPLLRVEKQ